MNIDTRSRPGATATLPLLLLALACGGDDGGPMEPTPRAVALVEVGGETGAFRSIGETRQFDAIARDASGDPVPEQTIVWSSSDPAVLTVDASTGRVTAVSNGTAEITAAAGSASGRVSLTVRQVAETVVVTPATASLSTVGAAQRFIAEARDANDVPVADARFSWQSSDPAVVVVDTAGRAVAKAEGEAVVAAQVQGDGVVGYAAVTVRQSATTLAFLTQPGDAVAGEALSPAIQVEIRDADGNRVRGASDAVTLSIPSDPGGAGIRGTRTVNAVDGVATFSGLWFERADTAVTLVASAAGLASVESAPFVVVPGEPAQLGFAVMPSDRVAGDTINVRVAVRDAWGNVVPDGAVTVELELGGDAGGAELKGVTAGVSASGIAPFAVVVERAASGYTLVARAEGLKPAESVTFDIAPGPAVVFAYRETPTRVEGQAPFRVRVALHDRFGNLATTSTDSITLELSGNPRGDVLLGTTTRAPVDGVVTFDDLSLTLPASGYRLTASWSRFGRVSTEPFEVGLTFTDVAVGARHACGVTVVGAAYCWGYNNSGQLGHGGSTAGFYGAPVAVAGGNRFVDVDVGADHSCGLTKAGAAYCWGSNSDGRLGDASAAPLSTTPVAVAGGQVFKAISAGSYHNCGLTSAGVAYCWGRNVSGALGDGTATSRNSPVPVATGLLFTAIDAGGGHTCALTSTGASYCWGENTYGQLGNGGAPTDASTPVPVATGRGFASITAGGNHTCARESTGLTYCWGRGLNGALGDGTTTDRAVPGDHLGHVAEAAHGDYVLSTVSAGVGYGCGTTPDDVALCWGGNESGAVGDGTTEDRLTPVAVTGGHRFTQVETGPSQSYGPVTFTCGLTRDGDVYCWGALAGGFTGGSSPYRSLVPVRVAP